MNDYFFNPTHQTENNAPVRIIEQTGNIAVIEYKSGQRGTCLTNKLTKIKEPTPCAK